MASARNRDVIEMFRGWEKEFEDAVDNDDRLVIVARVVTHKVRPLLKEAKQDTALYNAIREYEGFILTLTKAWNHKTSVAGFTKTAAAVIRRETLPRESPLAGPVESDLNPPPAAPLSPRAESPAAPEKPVNPPPAESIRSSSPPQPPRLDTRAESPAAPEKLVNPPPAESIQSSSPPQPPRLDKGKEKIKPRPTFGKRTAKGLSEGTPPPQATPPAEEPKANPVDEHDTQPLVAQDDLQSTLTGRCYELCCKSCLKNKRLCREAAGKIGCFYCVRSKHTCIFPEGEQKLITPSEPLGPPDPQRPRAAKAASSKSTKKTQPAVGDSQYDAIEIDSEEETAKAPTKRSNRAAKTKAKSRIKAEIKKTARKESDGDRDREADEDGDKVEDAPGPMLRRRWVAKPPPYIPIPDAVPDPPSTGELLDGPTNGVAAGAENARLERRVRVLEDTIVNLLHAFGMEEPLISGKRTDANEDDETLAVVSWGLGPRARDRMLNRLDELYEGGVDWGQLFKTGEPAKKASAASADDSDLEVSAIHPAGAASSSKATPKPSTGKAAPIISVNRPKATKPKAVAPPASSSTATTEVDGAAPRKRRKSPLASDDAKRRRVV
ncbi:unnamed protein product [Cyclocybe aegerita]|uniref:Uncharacterized protein n=1 Tax=Cyclocybe aegerita TaxID=1973307 RepID=A0A8S0W763_CYCAE|nr:unnamed protein product [Cyclocybe aegerita]